MVIETSNNVDPWMQPDIHFTCVFTFANYKITLSPFDLYNFKYLRTILYNFKIFIYLYI